MQNLDLCALLEPVVAVAREAGRKILDVYGTHFSVDIKADRSPLTAADMASHRCIVGGLRAFEAAWPLISEESDQCPYSERKKWETYWLIDPLDGTKEFIKRNGEFTVNIALVHRHQPVLGVVYVPVKQLCYFGCTGQGAFKQEVDGSAEAIQARTGAPEQLTVVGSRSHKTGELADYLSKLGPHCLISMGSSLKLCLVAEGAADLYPRLGLTSEWDTAAAHCIVEQAGGHVCTLGGEPLRYNTKESLLNPYFLVYGDDSRDWTAFAAGKQGPEIGDQKID